MEWLAHNIISLIALAITTGGLIYRIGQLVARIEDVEGTVKDMQITQRRNGSRITNHMSDTDKHVNHLYMQSIKETLVKNDARIDKLETTMNNGFDKINNKLDSIARKQ